MSGDRRKLRQGLPEAFLPTPTEWLKQVYGLPWYAEYLGFGVQMNGGDLFLACAPSGKGVSGMRWVSAAASAMLFGWREANSTAQAFPGSEVVLMFDVGDVIMVFPTR